MNREYRLKFDEMRQSNPTGDNIAETHSSFNSPSHVRNLCFAWPDNSHKFLNYAYLVSGEYLPAESVIVLAFTTEKVFIKGVNLESLFFELLEHRRKLVACQDERYNETNGEETIINEILIVE